MTTRMKNKLNDKAVKAAAVEPGRVHDGGGLWLQTTDRFNTSWEYRYERLNGKGRRTMGLGPYPKISLSKARKLRDDAAALVRDGVDPIAARKVKKQTAATSLTVMEAAEAYIAVMEVDWATERYPEQIRERLETYVAPIIGDMGIADIGLAEAKLVLTPIWNTIRPTAKRIRQHLEGAVDWAIAEGVRKDENNPFAVKRLRFSLSFADQKVTHFASLPYDQAPTFMTELSAQPDSVRKFALQFVMLNAVRVGDIAGGGKANSEPARWTHVNLTTATWTVPDSKTGKPHVVPLSDAAMAVLDQMKRYRDPANNVIFPGAVRGTTIAASTLRYLIADMGYKGLMTTHGCRSMFRTWAGETLPDYDKGVTEAALAHSQGALDSAYHRGSFLQKRRRLMGAWADYLIAGDAVSQGAEVVALRA